MFQSFKFICGEFLGIPTALHASNAWGEGSIPGWGNKVPHALWFGQENNKNNFFRKDIWIAVLLLNCIFNQINSFEFQLI